MMSFNCGQFCFEERGRKNLQDFLFDLDIRCVVFAEKCPFSLCNDVVDNVAVNVGEAEIATGVTMCQLRVIET